MTSEAIRMLEKLTWSENKQTACQAEKILTFEIYEDDALAFSGGFMKAVLLGDRDKAIKLADRSNFIALQNDKTEMNLHAEDN